MSEKIRILLEERKMTQSELARRAKISRSMVNKIINKKVNPSLALLERIAHALEVSVKDFF